MTLLVRHFAGSDHLPFDNFALPSATHRFATRHCTQERLTGILISAKVNDSQYTNMTIFTPFN
mgnify:CR=1 FL=1